MPTEARGNYLPEAPYLRETKTYLNCNCKPSPYLCNLLTDFREIWHSDAFWYPAPDVQVKFVLFDNLIWQSHVARVDRTCWQLFVLISIRPIFIFCCRSYVKLLDYGRAEKIFTTSGGPPEA